MAESISEDITDAGIFAKYFQNASSSLINTAWTGCYDTPETNNILTSTKITSC